MYRPFLASTTVYIAAPTNPVMMLRGISFTDNTLERVSTIIRNNPPDNADTGNAVLASSPANALEMWGITNPTHPTLPASETQFAVSKVAQAMIIRRSLLKLTPRDSASSEPKDITLILQPINAKTKNGIAEISRSFYFLQNRHCFSDALLL